MAHSTRTGQAEATTTIGEDSSHREAQPSVDTPQQNRAHKRSLLLEKYFYSVDTSQQNRAHKVRPTLRCKQADFISFLINHKVLQFGEFTTKSGRISPYFINFGNLCTATTLEKLAEFYATWLLAADKEFKPYNVIFGSAYKGIPLAVALTLVLGRRSPGKNSLGLPPSQLSYAFNRKESKKHGDGGTIVGSPITPTSEILLVDDVLTSGLALETTLTTLRALDTKVKISGILVGIDREERAHRSLEPCYSARVALERKYGIPVRAITTISTLLQLNHAHKWVSPAITTQIQGYMEKHMPTKAT